MRTVNAHTGLTIQFALRVVTAQCCAGTHQEPLQTRMHRAMVSHSPSLPSRLQAVHTSLCAPQQQEEHTVTQPWSGCPSHAAAVRNLLQLLQQTEPSSYCLQDRGTALSVLQNKRKKRLQL